MVESLDPGSRTDPRMIMIHRLRVLLPIEGRARPAILRKAFGSKVRFVDPATPKQVIEPVHEVRPLSEECVTAMEFSEWR